MSIASTCRTHFQVTRMEEEVLLSNDKICLSSCRKVLYLQQAIWQHCSIFSHILPKTTTLSLKISFFPLLCNIFHVVFLVLQTPSPANSNFIYNTSQQYNLCLDLSHCYQPRWQFTRSPFHYHHRNVKIKCKNYSSKQSLVVTAYNMKLCEVINYKLTVGCNMPLTPQLIVITHLLNGFHLFFCACSTQHGCRHIKYFECCQLILH